MTKTNTIQVSKSKAVFVSSDLRVRFSCGKSLVLLSLIIIFPEESLVGTESTGRVDGSVETKNQDEESRVILTLSLSFMT